jgi:hypothetical protein
MLVWAHIGVLVELRSATPTAQAFSGIITLRDCYGIGRPRT